MQRESIFAQIAADWRAVFARDPAAHTWLEVLLAYPGFHAVVAHRFIHPLYRWHVPVIPRLLSEINRFLTGVEIHPGARIQGGLFIDHGMGVVMGETTEIGRDCTLYQGVTLGGTSLQHGKRHPTLEDNVVVGAGAGIIGAIVVGANSKIAAVAVVVKDVPPNSTVVGVPGRVVLQDGKRIPESTTPKVDMPDPMVDAIAALSARVDELERQSRSAPGDQGRSAESNHGTAAL